MKIEEEFFKAFGIEKRKKGYCDWDSWCPYEDLTCGDDCPYWQYSEERYPEITDRKLLQLICILNNLTGRLIELGSSDINTLKEEILKICLFNYEVFRLSYKNKFIKQVKALFEGEE